jgi:hypothetical protein
MLADNSLKWDTISRFFRNEANYRCRDSVCSPRRRTKDRTLATAKEKDKVALLHFPTARIAIYPQSHTQTSDDVAAVLKPQQLME